MKRTPLVQLLLLAQAATIAFLAWSFVGPLNQAFDQYARGLLYIRLVGGGGLATIISFKVLPEIVWRAGIALAIGWWLGQQKKLVITATRDRFELPVLSRRTKIILASAMAALLVISSVILLHRRNRPPVTVTFSEADIESPSPTPSPMPHSVPLDDLEKKP